MMACLCAKQRERLTELVRQHVRAGARGAALRALEGVMCSASDAGERVALASDLLGSPEAFFRGVAGLQPDAHSFSSPSEGRYWWSSGAEPDVVAFDASSEIEAGEGVWYIRSMHPIPHGELRRGSHGRADVCAHALLETFHHRLAALEAGRTGAP